MTELEKDKESQPVDVKPDPVVKAGKKKTKEEQVPPFPPSVVPPISPAGAPQAAQDPLRIIMEIAENDKLSPQDKMALITRASERFKNRRRMAYIALATIVVSVGLLFLGAFVDGLSAPCPENHTCKGVLGAINESQTVFTWAEGFLAAIVGAYYGISGWRPSS